jgi:hypothetical protein
MNFDGGAVGAEVPEGCEDVGASAEDEGDEWPAVGGDEMPWLAGEKGEGGVAGEEVWFFGWVQVHSNINWAERPYR